jgi:RNA polymerase sigma-70 factor (ECF subfamily)
VNGAPGIVVAPAGHLRLVLVPTIEDGIITELDVIAEPERLEQLELAVLP